MLIPNDIREWRRSRRTELLARRHGMPRDERQRARDAILGNLRTHFDELDNALIGFYWPIRDEIDVTAAVEARVRAGADAALPVIVEKRHPLEFWAWRPGMKLEQGVWNIPVPPIRRVVHPTVLLVPVLGFDERRFRLGYGGGYYDRTLAAMEPEPFTIGIAYEDGKLESVHPQLHDIPLDAIVTEARVRRTPSTGKP